MPTHKDFKRLVRSRMRKTGEAYTTARARLLQKKSTLRTESPAKAGFAPIAGMIGQRRDGTFEANKSKTFPVPLSRLYRTWSDARLRARWLPNAAIRVRSVTPGKYMHMLGGAP